MCIKSNPPYVQSSRAPAHLSTLPHLSTSFAISSYSEMTPQIQNPLIAPGSLVLLTGANGLIGSHIVDQLLQCGYRVRGTVRSLKRCSWMEPLFASRHANSSLEIIEVADINAPGCYDSALKGVSAVIHSAADTSLSDKEGVIESTIEANMNVLEAVKNANKKGENIKRVVITSSSWAVQYPRPETPGELTADTYDTFAEGVLADENTPQAFRPLMTYVVSKKRSEQESWKWWNAQREDCGFVLNSVLPATCMGPALDAENQAYPSTVGFIRCLYEGKNAELFQWLEPQWYIDVRDAARLHVASAVLDGVEGERVYGYAKAYTWPEVAGVIEREMEMKVPIELKDKGQDLSTPVSRDVSEGYLKRLGLKGWVPLDESVKENIRAFYPKV
jgi:nucleoside-diphosphate-sugar epimerase